MSNRTDTLIVAGADIEIPAGIRLRNHRDPGVTCFAGRDRAGDKVNELILHETVTTTTAATVAVLKQRKLGVHLIVAPDGGVTQHGDLACCRLAHAAGHNGPSVGIEVVTPYYPAYAKGRAPWRRVIHAPWAHGGMYVVPTHEQAEATCRLVQLLTSSVTLPISIPRSWRGMSDTRLAMGRIPGGTRRAAGIYAHTYFNHADGAWLVLYAWLRLEAGLPPCIAYEQAIDRAKGVTEFIDVADLTSSLVA